MTADKFLRLTENFLDDARIPHSKQKGNYARKERINHLFHKQEQVLKISCLENDALFMHQIGMSKRNTKLSDCFLQLTSLVYQTISSYVMAYIITIDLENTQICVVNHLITHNEKEFKTNRRNRKL